QCLSARIHIRCPLAGFQRPSTHHRTPCTGSSRNYRISPPAGTEKLIALGLHLCNLRGLRRHRKAAWVATRGNLALTHSKPYWRKISRTIAAICSFSSPCAFQALSQSRFVVIFGELSKQSSSFFIWPLV